VGLEPLTNLLPSKRIKLDDPDYEEVTRQIEQFADAPRGKCRLV